MTLELANNIVRFPETTLQLKPSNGELKLHLLEPRAPQKTIIPLRQQMFVPVTAQKRTQAQSRGLWRRFLPSNAKGNCQITNHLDHIIRVFQHNNCSVRILAPSQPKNVQTMSNEYCPSEQRMLTSKIPEKPIMSAIS